MRICSILRYKFYLPSIAVVVLMVVMVVGVVDFAVDVVEVVEALTALKNNSYSLRKTIEALFK